MTKTTVKKSKKTAMERVIASSLPWSCTSFGVASEIEACIDSNWVTIADIHPVPGFDGEDIAGFIIRSVNGYGKLQPHLQKMKSVLELCQQREGVSPQEKRQIGEILDVLKQQTSV
ncbi:MAG: hypothetical protein KGI37_04875 [Alphaproteobacteria bacterium]|nr:hypothetical protein [Alphaproteobacteria bacterium]